MRTHRVLAVPSSLDGCHIVTTEGIGSKASPHAIQKAIADGNGSQCGFCTPGWVMGMYDQPLRISAPPTSALGLGSPPPHLHRDWVHPRHICTGTGPAPATSTLGQDLANYVAPCSWHKTYSRQTTHSAAQRSGHCGAGTRS